MDDGERQCQCNVRSCLCRIKMIIPPIIVHLCVIIYNNYLLRDIFVVNVHQGRDARGLKPKYLRSAQLCTPVFLPCVETFFVRCTVMLFSLTLSCVMADIYSLKFLEMKFLFLCFVKSEFCILMLTHNCRILMFTFKCLASTE